QPRYTPKQYNQILKGFLNSWVLSSFQYWTICSDHVATRMDNSLLVTTRKFLELKNFDESVNLNDAAEALNVPKRRLYDITNVLEGIDLVEKIGKNSIRWKTNDGDAMLLKRLQFDCNSLRCEEVELDSVLLDLTSALKLVKEDPTYKPYGYLQLQDLQSLDIFSNQTLIAVKSLHEAQSFIEVADPSKTGKFQIKVRAGSHSPLRAFLCPSNAHSYSNIEAILSSGDLDRAECSSCDSIPLWASQVDSRVILSESDERKPPKINEGSGATDIVLPECDYPQDSLSDLFTPDKVVFQEASSYLSPLKTLLEQHDQFPNNKETEVPITPHASDLDPYNFPSSGLNLSDLFSCSDWELTH
ncbi:transcription factor E2F/dimerization partner, partial [Ostertagia ostertagi]